jgi:hypothetical protein
MARRKPSAHQELDALEQRIAAARLAERGAEQELRETRAEVEAARDAVREAHDLGQPAREPTARLDRAKGEVEQAQLALEGVGQRVRRATADRDRFLEENGARLLDEIGPDCDRVVIDMRLRAEALLEADREWSRLSQTVATYLRGMNLSPAENSRGEHELAQLVKDVRRALQHRISSPSPHMATLDAAMADEERKKELREQRAAARQKAVETI